MSAELVVEVTHLAARHIREAEEWWRKNRTAAPNAVRQQLDRAFTLIASQPRIGGRATNVRRFQTYAGSICRSSSIASTTT
jgi:plasmid stabilization system protein ParE